MTIPLILGYRHLLKRLSDDCYKSSKSLAFPNNSECRLMFMATTNLKQETVLAQARAQAAGANGFCFTFSFASVEVEQAFSSVLHSEGIRKVALQLEIA